MFKTQESDDEKLFEFFLFLENMSINKRWGTTKTFIKKESIADHTFAVLVVVFFLHKKIWFSESLLKMLTLALTHDIIEAVVWDTDYNLVYRWMTTKEEKAEKEREAIKEIRTMLPDMLGKIVYDTWMEYELLSSKEAWFVRAIEKTETILHTVCCGHSYIDIPDKFATYCDNAIKEHKELHDYYAEVNKKLKELFDRGDFEWKEHYHIKGDFEGFEEFFSLYKLLHSLKEQRRFGNTSKMEGKRDSVAEHSFRLVFFVFLSYYHFHLDIDLEKTIKMAMFHDIGEGIVGDIDVALIYKWIITKQEKYEAEKKAMEDIKSMLPHEIGEEVFLLWEEYEKAETKEAQILKALDKFEGILHILYCGHEHFDTPDLIALHCDKYFQKVPELFPLLKILKTRLKTEYQKWGREWKAEYDVWQEK